MKPISDIRQQRIDALTGIRAIAAIMVFLYHFRKFWRDDLPIVILKPFNEFHTGVSLFFVLSGFLIAYTYGDKPLKAKSGYVKYWLIRIARIFPVYLLILSLKYFDEGFPSFKEATLNYSLLKGFSDKLNLTGIPQSWSLTVELTFYTFAPFIYRSAKKNFFRTAVYLLLLLVITIIAGYSWHYWLKNPNDFFYNWFFVLNGTFMGRFPEFLAGIALALFVKSDRPPAIFFPNRNTITGGSGIIICIYIISLFEKDIYSHGTDHIAGLVIRNIFFPVCTIQFYYGLITEKTWLQKFLSTRLMILLGNASYIFYLIHISYGYRLVEKIHVFPDRNFTLLWFISVILYLLIEKPIYENIKKLIRKKN